MKINPLSILKILCNLMQILTYHSFLIYNRFAVRDL